MPEHLTVKVNGKWIDFGFARLDFGSGKPKTLARRVIKQYFELGHTDKPEAVKVSSSGTLEEVPVRAEWIKRYDIWR